MDNRPKILIVDDSSIIRKIIKKSISPENFEIVGEASNGKMALEIHKEFLPDIVTLDITMPEMDGLTVLDMMLEHKPDTKVIIISALTDKATGIKAIKKGAKSYLPKPFTTADIQKIIDKLALNL